MKPNPQELAQGILDYIEMFPDRHEQTNWVTVDGYTVQAPRRTEKENMCNTTMCAAGTAVYLSRPFSEFQKFDGSFATEGRELLGLTHPEADDLFYSNNETAVKLLGALAEGDKEKFNRIVRGEEYETV